MLVVLAIAAIAANAQVEAGFRQGVRVNLGASNVSGEGDKMTFGYGLGWVAEYNFSPKFYVQSGLGLENIAHKEEGISGTINAYYLQLPIHAGYRFELGETNSLFVQAGPTLGVGLFGSKVDFGGGDEINYFDVAKRFDLGLGGKVGVEFGKFQVSVGANYGVLQAVKEVDGYHNLTVNAGFTYFF
ncbi:MAG: PorT family protein [Lachnospiraceae bacterium]|nr:PorT family protein [Lachnospiraceae bacterium]